MERFSDLMGAINKAIHLHQLFYIVAGFRLNNDLLPVPQALLRRRSILRLYLSKQLLRHRKSNPVTPPTHGHRHKTNHS